MGLIIALVLVCVGFSLVKTLAYACGDLMIVVFRHPSIACFILAFLFLSAGIAARVYRVG